MEAAQARLSIHMSKCHIVGNHMSWLILNENNRFWSKRMEKNMINGNERSEHILLNKFYFQKKYKGSGA